ncbi:hypothetical protein ARMGADRAFT_1030709 [Armillaria gallica]|uniref:Tetratricopeptide repeat protein n=1 Tax=Armillaria gallica TaxID=47427 RepID=A0A2H3DVT5_ARMGA|nr:hypothetical protein ARMGADRAFT_1030709 [Armillaria gallica]
MSIFFGGVSSGIPQDEEPILQKVSRYIREGEYSQAEEILLDQKKRYQSLSSLPGEMGTYREVLREFYTKQWTKAVQYYQEGLELFKQCELVEGFDNGSGFEEAGDARKNMKECSEQVRKE